MSMLEYKLTASWETEHDTVNGVMTHTFNDHLKVVSNLRAGEIKIIADGAVVRTVDGSKMSVKEYTEFIAEIAVDVAVNALINDLAICN